MSYKTAITNKQTALVHLLIYCTYHDEKFTGDEYNQLKRVITFIRSCRHIDIDAEVEVFKGYKNEINNVQDYLLFVLNTINSRYPLAIFSYAAQMLVADIDLTVHDKEVLDILATHMGVSEADKSAIIKTMIARQLISINFL